MRGVGNRRGTRREGKEGFDGTVRSAGWLVGWGARGGAAGPGDGRGGGIPGPADPTGRAVKCRWRQRSLFARTLAALVEKEKALPQPIVVENKPGGSGMVAFAYVAGKRRNPYFLLTAGPGLIAVPYCPQGDRDFPGLHGHRQFCVRRLHRGGPERPPLQVGRGSRGRGQGESEAGPGRWHPGGKHRLDGHLPVREGRRSPVQLHLLHWRGRSERRPYGRTRRSGDAEPRRSLELAKAKKVRVLCVMAEKRHPGAADVPTCREQGVDVVWRQHRGLAAPADIPADARTVLEEALFKSTQTAGFKIPRR